MEGRALRHSDVNNHYTGGFHALTPLVGAVDDSASFSLIAARAEQPLATSGWGFGEGNIHTAVGWAKRSRSNCRVRGVLL